MDYKLPKDYKKPDDCIEGYISPIGIYQSDIEPDLQGMLQSTEEEREKYLLSQIKMAVNVDKEELIKALQYDRNQYDKGYQNAKAKYDRGHGHWILERSYGDGKSDYCCSVCNYDDTMYDTLLSFYKYCPYCGAIMDEEVEE